MERNKAWKILYDVWRRTGLGTAQSRDRRVAFEIALSEMLELDGCRPGGERISDEYPREAKRVEALFRRLRTE